MRTIAHITHEAVYKSGGIGSVLEGLLTSGPYSAADLRTILVGPLFPGSCAKNRLGPGGEVLFSSLDGFACNPQLADSLYRVCCEFHVSVVYGHRPVVNSYDGRHMLAEVVLIGVDYMSLDKINAFKAGLWQSFRIDSKRYEDSCEYDLYVKLAQPALAALRALGAANRRGQCLLMAHEFMGLPTALATTFDDSGAFRTIFYAHEVATVRPIIEHHPGHDVMFYNVMNHALSHGRYLDDVFGPQDHYYRHPLIKAAANCDKIVAVGDDVARELRFLGPCMESADIEVAYNGIPFEQIALKQRKQSRERLKDYAEALLGDRPDYIFSHVTRTVTSKGLWRDFRVLEHLEQTFRQTGKTAVLFVLSTELPARSPETVAHMEAEWDWPVAHREKDGDLAYNEAIFHAGVQQFNARSRQIKIVFVNQFGWSRALCGQRMPAEMRLRDLRCGTDAEFGQSIYEPFGIAQLEPLTYGGICVVSRVCGCAGLVQHITAGHCSPNVIIADYDQAGLEPRSEQEWLCFSRQERHKHEVRVAADVAARLAQALPTNDLAMEALLERGASLAAQMSWDAIARRFILPMIDRLCEDRPATMRWHNRGGSIEKRLYSGQLPVIAR